MYDEDANRFWCSAPFLLLVMVSAILVTVALTVWNQQDKEEESGATSVPSAQQQDSMANPLAHPTPLSEVPSMTPTTLAPTSDAFGIMTSHFFTNPEQDSPSNPTSPQWRALKWLVGEDSFLRKILPNLRRLRIINCHNDMPWRRSIMQLTVKGM
jgi:hypothetical protein